jgi:hypothetical protein
VAFLNCVNALRPILPKSQAWCVDGDSKFVLQIRPPQYWRIEVPNKSADEKLQIEELKKVLGEVLRFEKTPCPFQRDFTVELPEPPQTPIKKRPWRPVERPKVFTSSSSEEVPTDNGRLTPQTSEPSTSPSSPAQELATSPIEAQVSDTKPEEACSPLTSAEIGSQPVEEESDISYVSTNTTLLSEQPASSNILPFEPATPTVVDVSLKPYLLETPVADSIFADYAGFEEESEESDRFSDATDDANITPRSHFQPIYQPLTFEPEKRERPQAIQNCSRSVTAPPILSLVTSPPSKHRAESPLRCSTIVESDSDYSSSVESFHTVQSWHSPLAPPSPPASGPPSPSTTYPYPHDNITLPKRPHHTRDVSELTVTPETPRVWPDMEMESRSVSPPPRTPTLVNDPSEKSDEEQSEIVTPPTVRPLVRHRATTSSNSRRRALSPLPAAVNLFSPPRRHSRRLQTARHLPTIIIRKTCEILLSPPSHLFQLMISIASKIAAGEWRGVLLGHGEAVHWDFEDEYAGEGWFEDDYGISLTGHGQNTSKTPSITSVASATGVAGGSWEVD